MYPFMHLRYTSRIFRPFGRAGKNRRRSSQPMANNGFHYIVLVYIHMYILYIYIHNARVKYFLFFFLFYSLAETILCVNNFNKFKKIFLIFPLN